MNRVYEFESSRTPMERIAQKNLMRNSNQFALSHILTKKYIFRS